jgi:hypothetical protein
MLADGILQCGAALAEFLADFTFAFENQQRVREGVIANDVAGSSNLTDDLRTLLHVPPD